MAEDESFWGHKIRDEPAVESAVSAENVFLFNEAPMAELDESSPAEHDNKILKSEPSSVFVAASAAEQEQIEDFEGEHSTAFVDSSPTEQEDTKILYGEQSSQNRSSVAEQSSALADSSTEEADDDYSNDPFYSDEEEADDGELPSSSAAASSPTQLTAAVTPAERDEMTPALAIAMQPSVTHDSESTAPTANVVKVNAAGQVVAEGKAAKKKSSDRKPAKKKKTTVQSTNGPAFSKGRAPLVSSARVSDLTNQVRDLERRLEQARMENLRLNRQQKSRDRSLADRMGVSVEQLVERHNEEVRVLREHLRREKEKIREQQRLMASRNKQLERLSAKAQRLQERVADTGKTKQKTAPRPNKLPPADEPKRKTKLRKRDDEEKIQSKIDMDVEKEKIAVVKEAQRVEAEQTNALKEKLDEKETRLEELENQLSVLKEKYKQQFEIEVSRHKETQVRLNQLEAELVRQETNATSSVEESKEKVQQPKVRRSKKRVEKKAPPPAHERKQKQAQTYSNGTFVIEEPRRNEKIQSSPDHDSGFASKDENGSSVRLPQIVDQKPFVALRSSPSKRSDNLSSQREGSTLTENDPFLYMKPVRPTRAVQERFEQTGRRRSDTPNSTFSSPPANQSTKSDFIDELFGPKANDGRTNIRAVKQNIPTSSAQRPTRIHSTRDDEPFQRSSELIF